MVLLRSCGSLRRSQDHGLIDCATCATFNVNCDNVNGRSSSAQQLQVAGARGACISMPSGDEAVRSPDLFCTWGHVNGLYAQAVARPFGICRAPARFIASRTSALRAAYDSEAVGASESMEFRVFFKDGGKRVSPWHDIPLKNGDGSFNFICEIPKESDAKMEVATDETANPIKQDTKKGKLRFYPYNINWNYGMLPQTWEDPGHKNEELDGVFGDNDPVDVVEIGSAALPMGSVHNVKVLGVYAMIDDGELDWKVIAINTNDPKASSVNDVEDVEREFPGELEKIMIWFRDYKMPDGKPANSYGYDNQCMNREFALKVIEETNGFYLKLKSGERVNDEELSLA